MLDLSNLVQENLPLEELNRTTNEAINEKSYNQEVCDIVPINDESMGTESNLAQTSNVNCFALTIREDYKLSIAKNVVIKTFKNTWRVTLAVFVLNLLASFF